MHKDSTKSNWETQMARNKRLMLRNYKLKPESLEVWARYCYSPTLRCLLTKAMSP